VVATAIVAIVVTAISTAADAIAAAAVALLWYPPKTPMDYAAYLETLMAN
jgi:hypothetical protein